MAKGSKSGGVLLSSEEKIYSVFAYFGVLCLVPILEKRDNEFVLFRKAGVGPFHHRDHLRHFADRAYTWLLGFYAGAVYLWPSFSDRHGTGTHG